MKISKSSKLQIFLGKKIYGNPESLGYPCSAEEFYSNPSDRVSIQPLLHVDAVKEDENMKRALAVNVLRLDAARQISIFTVPYMLAVYLVFVIATGIIKPTNPLQAMAGSTTPTADSVEDVSTIGAYAGGAFSWAKVHTLGYLQSDETKLARVKELDARIKPFRNLLETKANTLKQTSNNDADFKEKMKEYENKLDKAVMADSVEFNSLHGNARLGLEKVKQQADFLKQQFANGSINQQQFDDQKAKILEDQKKYQDQLN